MQRILSYRTKDEKPDAHFVDWVGSDDDFTPAEQRQRDGGFRPRSRERASPCAMVRAAYWATKLLPYAGCRHSAQCPWPVLLVTSRPLSRRGLLLRPLLAIRILCAVLRILPAVGLVRHWTSLVVVIAAACFGPAANLADSPRFGRESASNMPRF